ncbi:hypothetical protein GGF44_003136 [Coemansia sp. RSA 1694]|nr:hypothetical protein GGF44_003136 [Coemansia sp. RSA 1694]
MDSVIAKAAVAFTGGKDSVLALHLVSHRFHTPYSSQPLLDPVVLVSFRPSNTSNDFKAHKHEWTCMQAASLGLPLVTKYITSSSSLSYEDSYRACIRELADEYGITKLVTGDIEDVGEGFMDRAVQTTGVELVRPLWKIPRPQILDMLQTLNIVYIVTLTRLDKLPAPVSERLLGHIITPEYLLEQFAWYDTNHVKMDLANTVDLAGEFGEMHSMVINCPLFRHQVVQSGGTILVSESQFGSYMYLSPGELSTIPK